MINFGSSRTTTLAFCLPATAKEVKEALAAGFRLGSLVFGVISIYISLTRIASLLRIIVYGLPRILVSDLRLLFGLVFKTSHEECAKSLLVFAVL